MCAGTQSLVVSALHEGEVSSTPPCGVIFSLYFHLAPLEHWRLPFLQTCGLLSIQGGLATARVFVWPQTLTLKVTRNLKKKK